MKPTIAIVIPIRDRQKTLPQLFKNIQNLKYPKNKIKLFWHTNDNKDKTYKLLCKYMQEYGNQYAMFGVVKQDYSLPVFNGHIHSEIKERCRPTLCKIFNRCLDIGIDSDTDFVLFKGADVVFSSPVDFSNLIKHDLDVVAPFLTSWIDNMAPGFKWMVKEYDIPEKIQVAYAFDKMEDGRYEPIAGPTCQEKFKFTGLQQVDVALGCILFKRDVFVKVNPRFRINPEFLSGQFEFDFCKQITDAGYKIWVDGSIRAEHLDH